MYLWYRKREVFGYVLHFRIMEPINGRNAICRVSSFNPQRTTLINIKKKLKNHYLTTAGCIGLLDALAEF